MQAFYINLDGRTDRRAHMQACLGALGLDAERVPATAPADIAPDLLARHCDTSRDTWITPPELGAALSHRRVWQAVLDRDLPGALVLEDDVLLSPRLPPALPRLAGALADIDLLRIETRRRDYVLGRATHALPDGLTLHPPGSFEWGAAGYLVSRAGAELLLSAPEPFARPVDNLMFDPRGPLFARLRILQVSPALCMPRDADPDGCWSSDIQAGRSARVKQQWKQRRRQRVQTGGADPLRDAPWPRRLWRTVVSGQRRTVVPFAGPAPGVNTP